MNKNMIEWLAHGERGISSETIFSVLTGIDVLRGWRKSHPYDPDDLRRCRILLEKCPELQKDFHKMSKVSNTWEILVKNWDAICKTMDEECPDWRTNPNKKASKTYLLMKQVFTLAGER